MKYGLALVKPTAVAPHIQELAFTKAMIKEELGNTSACQKVSILVKYFYIQLIKILHATVDNQDHRPDTAKRNTRFYSLRDFKNITKEDFLNLDSKKLDTFLIRNNFDEKYRDSSIKELVRTDKIKPSAIYDYLFD